MGQETVADAVFPPYPSVLHGALRTAAYFKHHDQFTGGELIDQYTSDLYLKQFFFKSEENYWFPLPLDFFVQKDLRTSARIGLLRKNDSSNNALRYLVLPDYHLGESSTKHYFSFEDLEKYIAGRMDDTLAKPLSELFTVEEKIGNGRNDDTLSVEEGLLYSTAMIRPKVTMMLEVESRLLINESMTRLGGESKLVQISQAEDRLNFPIPDADKSWIKVYLTTPAIFPDTGWKPDFSLELQAACVGKYIPIGGFDQKSNEPKSMLRAVPAGSVYFYKGTAAELAPILDLHGKSICSAPYNAQGFGIAYCANVHESQLHFIK
jgi:CRISPR-associated protein Cmr3